MRRGELESRLLILVTLALVAFGLVMVYSATSAAAAVGGNDPNYYLKRQGAYAALGIGLMILAQRSDYRKLRALAPGFVLVSLGMLAAVLVVGPAVNGARRWISFGPAVFQPSEFAKLAVAVWAAAYLSGRKPPRDLRDLWRPVGALATLFSALLILEPDMGTAIALLVMLAGMLLVAGTPARDPRRRARDRRRARHRGGVVRALPARAVLRVPASVARRAGHRLPDRPGDDRDRLGRTSSAWASARGCRRSSTSPRRTRT